jgi:anaerobic magnesium-protoporphyrin IX monomethyl ester cyclase
MTRIRSRPSPGRPGGCYVSPVESVLILSGPLLDGHERSLATLRRKAGLQSAHRRMGWLNAKMKLVMGEPMLYALLERRRPGPPRIREALDRMVRDAAERPTLTEVILADCLARQGIPSHSLPLSRLFDEPAHTEALLAASGCVFLSSTFLYDVGELEGLAHFLKRPHNHVVVGGALTAIVHEGWEGLPELDVVAVGYGEYLVPALAGWIRSGYRDLAAPAGGRLVRKRASLFLHGGAPPSRDLDFLPRPRWPETGKPEANRAIEYESVRGCPYRCSFCNYPFLFDDHVFRYKSAAKMAEDWLDYARSSGVRTIVCLDSLFTMPRKRLMEFCRRLIRDRVGVDWVCYARADDLVEEETVVLMKSAGAIQVHIGIESGSDEVLRHMNKKCTVASNRRALENCRKHGLATLVTVIVGHPGETRKALGDTYRFLAETGPDFYFATLFTPRAPAIPILKPENRKRFGLEVVSNLYSTPPYWGHDTLDCTEVGDLARDLDRRLMENRVSLNAALFHDSLLAYRPALREPLLDFQARALRRPLLRLGFGLANRFVNWRLRRDYRKASLPLPALEPREEITGSR